MIGSEKNFYLNCAKWKRFNSLFSASTKKVNAPLSSRRKIQLNNLLIHICTLQEKQCFVPGIATDGLSKPIILVLPISVSATEWKVKISIDPVKIGRSKLRELNALL